MVHFEKVVTGQQEVYLALRECVKSNEIPTKEQLAQWEETMKQVLKAEHERVFIIMTAQTKGWSFAKELDFLQSGMSKVSKTWFSYMVIFNVLHSL